MIRIAGFDNGQYWLEETVAPAPYTLLEGRQKFIIGDSNANATLHNSTVEPGKIALTTGTGISVVNLSGLILPNTGGIGTTVFYVSGAALALGAVVLLITKKRMGAGE